MRFFLACALVCAPFFLTYAQTAPPGLRIEAVGFPDDRGFAMFALHADASTFLKKVAPFRAGKVAITGGTARIGFDDVPAGRYALAVFHDANANFDLDANWIGIPTEAFGFSNDARGKFGPPKFNQAAFDFDGKSAALRVTLDASTAAAARRAR